MAPKLLKTTLHDYTERCGKQISDYDLIHVEHSGTHRIWKNARALPITKLEEKVRQDFVNHLPNHTEAVVGMRKDLGEILPSAFFPARLQYVSYSGTALVPKKAE